jgi:hypothetical protein
VLLPISSATMSWLYPWASISHFDTKVQVAIGAMKREKLEWVCEGCGSATHLLSALWASSSGSMSAGLGGTKRSPRQTSGQRKKGASRKIEQSSIIIINIVTLQIHQLYIVSSTSRKVSKLRHYHSHYLYCQCCRP